MTGILSWALPLTCTVLFYGLAAGVWKQTSLYAAQFCILFAVAKTFTNWGAWLLWSRRRPLDYTSRAFMGWSFLGQLINGLAWIFYFLALSTGPVAIVQTVTAAYTALAAVLALFFLRERLIAVQFLGVALVIGAGMLLGYTTGVGEGQQDSPWFLYSLLCLCCWGVAVVIFKHAYNQEGADDYRFFLVNWLAMGLTVLPFGYLTLDPAVAVWQGPELAKGILIVLMYCIGDLTLFAAIARGPASIVSPLSGLYPVPTLAYAALVLHEVITPLQWLAIGSVLLAIVLIVPESDNPIMRLLGRRSPAGAEAGAPESP